MTAPHDDAVRWRQIAELAQVSSPRRVALVSLRDLAAPPMVLTDSAAVIWSLLDGERDLTAVIAQTAEEFEVEPDFIHDDVAAFVEDLAARDLIERADDSS